MTEGRFPASKTGSDIPDAQSAWLRQSALRIGGVPVFVFEDPETLGAGLAAEIIGLLQAKGSVQFLLGCPSGRSLQSTYSALALLTQQHDVDLSHLVIVMMDEYLDQGPSGLAHCSSDAHYSCIQFARTRIIGLLNAGRPDDQQIPQSNIWVPDPADTEAFDHRIEDAGGVDLFLVASGSSDGHVAFNPPGTPLDSPTSVLELADSTRRDNMDTFPAFADLEEVPQFGVGVGLATIADLSRRVALVMTGSAKLLAVRELARRRTFEADWPATVVFESNNPAIFVDRAAAEGFGSSVKTVNRKHDDPGRTGQ